MTDVSTIENFYGVYLLYCKNPKYTGRTYVGYTVDPNRRIKQHNKGKKAGGAWRTSNRGPWSMVMIIHGFPTDIAALRFEWAWQHPLRSRRLRHVARKKAKEKVFDYHLRILSEMLVVGPWNRLPLTIRWLDQEFCREFPGNKIPPLHMPVCYGPVVSKKLPKTAIGETRDVTNICGLCSSAIEDKSLSCLNSDCDLVAHVVCMSKSFLTPGEYVPIEGSCPKCNARYLWGDVVRKHKGCYRNADISIGGVGDDFYSSDSD